MEENVLRIDIEIDKLTNSIENTFSRGRFETMLLPVKEEYLKSIKKREGFRANAS